MLNISGLDPMMMILLILAISGVVSYGMTQVLKMALLKWDETHHDQWWFNTAIRAVAGLAGCGIGFVLVHSALGVCIGLCGGVLNTTIVAIIKSRLGGVQLPDQIPHTPAPPIDQPQDPKIPPGGVSG